MYRCGLVGELEAALAFYRDGPGLATHGITGTEFEHGAVVFFEMNEDLILALYPGGALAKNTTVTVGASSASEFAIGHIVGSKEEVDAVMEQAEAAGAHVSDAARQRFWGGYPGYVQDPDGHLWEIAWNPVREVRDEGRLRAGERGCRRAPLCRIIVFLQGDRQ